METHLLENIRVGIPDIAPDAPSHVRGIHEGNAGRRVARVRTGRRSTGVAWRHLGPIDPRMPNLSPA
jgi:hypothetical protein